jgi:hypothetical protein
MTETQNNPPRSSREKAVQFVYIKKPTHSRENAFFPNDIMASTSNSTSKAVFCTRGA